MTVREKRVPAPLADEQGQAGSVVDQHLRAAAAERASDVHLEPKDDHVRVRFRIEGVLHERKPLPLELGIAVISRLKMLAKMDMAERRIPQDGKFSTMIWGRSGPSASIFPSIHGETIVLRIASPAMAVSDLKELGLPSRMVPVVEQALHRPSGMILTTGPTSSGRSSTLYSLIQLLDPVKQSIITLEEGIEARLPMLTQGETNARAGSPRGLASIEGQDPDVILWGDG